MSIDHLLNSRVAVDRLEMSTSNGRAMMVWVPQLAPLNYVRGRLDLNFLRPGKDIPQAAEAGKAPDRIGVFFCSATAGLKAGDRIRAVPNDVGRIPVPGTFEIRVIPDVAQGYSDGHHIEVQIIETSQFLEDRNPDDSMNIRAFPGGDED